MSATTNSGSRLAAELDRADPLRRFREQFHIPLTDDGREVVYLVGNSLGLQPRRTAGFVMEELEKWKRIGVRGHFEGDYPWMPYHEFLAEPMARIVGALPEEVVMMNSLTVNLHLMLATFFQPTPARHAIVVERHAFPSDCHAVESHIRLRGGEPDQSLVTLRPGYGEWAFKLDDVDQLLEERGQEVAVMLIPGVQYYTGQVFPIREIVTRAHRYGIVVGVDLAHAAGNIELSLHEWNVDFAVWCSYKYLNSGPGSVGGCFVHKRHATNTGLVRMAGWWGHDKETRFQMNSDFVPIPTAEGWQLSNPPILSLAAIRASLTVFEEIGSMQPLVDKARQLNLFLRQQLQERVGDRVHIITPPRSGCQVSLEVKGVEGSPSGRDVHRALLDAGIEVDWREPNVIRAAPVPLYNTFDDVWRFVDTLAASLGLGRSSDC